MKLFEFQAKELFSEAGIRVPRGVLIGPPGNETGANDAEKAVAELGGEAVLKAQILMGGRGKKGLIRKVFSGRATGGPAAVADELFSSSWHVPTILVEELVTAERELYLSITVDANAATALVLASADGGVDIEELARTRPDAIHRVPVAMERGLAGWQARALAYDLELEGDRVKEFAVLLAALWNLFRQYDAELVEINPLFVTSEGLIAGDGKVSIDDNSLFRQKRYELTRDHFESDAEYEAAQEGIPYLQFDGDISLMCAGAGLTTTVYDLVHYEGGTIANYLEFGGPHYRKAKRAMELCLQNDSKVILIVTFGTIARADVMAEGVVEAIRELRPDRPIITCIRGTNEEAAEKTLRDAGLEPLFDTEEAVRRAVAIAAEGKTVEGRPSPPTGGQS